MKRLFVMEIALLMVLALLIPMFGVAEDLEINLPVGEPELTDSLEVDDFGAVELGEVATDNDLLLDGLSDELYIEELEETQTESDEDAEAEAEFSENVTKKYGVPLYATLGMKETMTIKCPKKNLTYLSSSAQIAKVSKDGVITAVKKGKATITIYSNKKKLTTCKVTVVAAPNKVSWGMKVASMGLKESMKIIPLINKGSHTTFTFTSKNKEIAKVSAKGVISAKKVGITTITVTTHNGKKAALKLLVQKLPTKVAVKPKKLLLDVGQTKQLSATLPKKTASFHLTWKSSNVNVATVDKKGNVTAVGEGTAKVTVETYNRKKAVCAVTVKAATVEPSEAVKALAAQLGISIEELLAKSGRTLEELNAMTEEELEALKEEILAIVQEGDFKIQNGVVIGYIGNGGAVNIPANYGNGYPVVAIGASAFKDNTAITSVVISSNVTEIRASAFEGCSALSSISIPASVITLDDTAFNNCPFDMVILGDIGSVAEAFADAHDIRFADQKSGHIELTANDYELTQTDTDTVVYAYAKVTKNLLTPTVELYKDNNELVGVMLDDGLYSTSGDDLSDDGVFTCKFQPDLTDTGNVNYYARMYFESGSEVFSEPITIRIVLDASKTTISEVDKTIESALEETNFEGQSEEERVKTIEDTLNKMVEAGQIKSDFSYSNDTGLYAFEYNEGILGGIMTREFNDSFDGVSITKRSQDYTGPVTEPVPGRHNNSLRANASNGSIGRAAIYFAFERTSFRLDFYQNTVVPDWNDKGLATDFKDYLTVSDMAGLDGSKYNVIVIAMHGSYYKTSPVYCLDETASDSKDKQYSGDLSNNRIARVTLTSGETKYWVLPSFFTHHLSSKALSNTFVFSQPCCSFGKGSDLNESMADAFLGRGARVFCGPHNSVQSVYGRNFMKMFVDELIEGENAGDAYDTCVSQLGATDGGNPAATPHFRGDRTAYLVERGLKNPDFEMDSTPLYWLTTGDVRVISQLGSLKPPHGKNMALLTTGIGSAESEYLAGTEGSVMRQTFRVPSSANTLSFVYDYVSEEPMEYVGTKYDDVMKVQLLDEDSKILTELVMESINTSTWTSISGINFEGGDDTTYEIGWKKVSCDISSLRDKNITLQTIVYDRGDSKYDSVVLIDNFVIK